MAHREPYRLKAHIDDACTACGLCCDTCPDVFEMGDDIAQVVVDYVPEEHEGAVEQAVEECPMEAITTVRVQARHFEQVLLLYLTLDGRIKVLPLFRDQDGKLIRDTETRLEFYFVNKLRARLMEKVEELEELLSKDPLPEKEIQAFFERNPEFILDGEYCEALPHVVLEDASGRRLIPDFILRPEAAVHVPAKIVELKLPSVPVSHSYPRGEMFSQRVIRAIGQLKRYYRYFTCDENRRRFFETYRFDVYMPRLCLIIGKDVTEIDEETYQDLKATLMGIDIQTYQEVLSNFRSRVEQILGK